MRTLMKFRRSFPHGDEVLAIAQLWGEVKVFLNHLGTPDLPVRWFREGNEVRRVMRFPNGEYVLIFRKEGGSLVVGGELSVY